MSQWKSLKVYAQDLAAHITAKYDRGEQVSPQDVLDRITNEPEFDDVVELCTRLGIFPQPVTPRYVAAKMDAAAARGRMVKAVKAYIAAVIEFWEQKAKPSFDWLTAQKDYQRNLHAALHCDVGLGKTYIAREQVRSFIMSAKKKGLPHRVLWPVPHHALSKETFASFETAGVMVAVWRGREAEDPSNVLPDGSFGPMCRDYGAIRDTQIVGADPDRTVCSTLEGSHCPFLAECSYKSQRVACEEADVVIAAHNVLFTPLGSRPSTWWKFGCR